MSTNPIIARAVGHLNDAEVRSVEVPEWGEGDKPLVIHYRSRMTVRERERIYNAEDGRPVTGFAASARCLMLMALKEDGKRMFDELDLHALTHNVDQAVVARIALKILADTGQTKTAEDQVDAAKNG